MKISYQEALTRLIEHREIFEDEMVDLMRNLMQGNMPSEIAAAFLMGLRVKKETVDEITAAATVMREFSKPVILDNPEEALDMCGTGGDGSDTFNISTTAMFVAAAAGVPIAKHGNRSASSPAGSADGLEALGAFVETPPEGVADSLRETGIGFMFAPYHHSSMKNVAPVRKLLGVRTMFNILGPLTNPAKAANQLMGVFHPDLVGIQVRVLKQLGANHVLIVHGLDGMDEATLGATTLVGELKDGQVTEYEIHPEDFGMQMVSNRSYRVKNKEESRDIILSVLKNEASPALDVVILNAGLAIYTGNKANSIKEGIEIARELLANGSAFTKMQQFCEFSQTLRPQQ
ncbi:MAG: anthranilate phosphoribosyltransferase [Alcaligenaceae bacterium]|jgi:anthranilate phosphoribosyltransferase|nr:anthranilate phosphoribosyltransferase [Alcaligenaceae bacterium]